MPYPLIGAMKDHLDAVGLDIADIDKLAGVTKGIFGLEWLENLLKKRNRDSNPYLQHPILVGCSSGSFLHLMELLELCTYILAFRNDKELPKIIPSLKKRSSYDDFLFQLAMAYRFKKLGFKVELEPPIANGKSADFSAHFGDLHIMAECTVSREWRTTEEERNSFFECQKEFKKLHNKSGKQILVDIISKTSLNFAIIQKLRTDIMRASADFIKSGELTTVSSELYTVSVSEVGDWMKRLLISDTERRKVFEGWKQVVSFKLATAKIPDDISYVDLDDSSYQSLMRYKTLLSAEEEFAYSLEDIIDKKISGKSEQLKAHPKDHTSLLFLKVSDKLKKIDSDRVGLRIWNGVFKKTPSVNAVFLTERDWINETKHQYQGTLFNNHYNSMNEHLFLGFNTAEAEMDFVKEWRNEMKE